MTVENLHERMLPTRRGSKLPPPDHQSDAHTAESPRPADRIIHKSLFNTGTYYCLALWVKFLADDILEY